eukprot:3059352-Alexandrium_andersonii.AAC.1
MCNGPDTHMDLGKRNALGSTPKYSEPSGAERSNARAGSTCSGRSMFGQSQMARSTPWSVQKPRTELRHLLKVSPQP